MQHRLLIGIVAVATCLRVAVALLSIGTNDVRLWQRFGAQAWGGGFYSVWAHDTWMNHPPLPVAYARLAYAVARDDAYRFALLIKLPGLVGDAVSTWLIYHVVSGRRGRRAALVAASLYAINPAAILITGYHGNVDALLAMFVLLGWHLAGQHRDAAAGAATGAAINVKLVPAPGALLLLATARSARAAFLTAGALAAASVPFAWMLFRAGRPFFERTVGYRPMSQAWLTYLPSLLEGRPIVGQPAQFLSRLHRATLVTSTFLWIAILIRRDVQRGRRDDRLKLGALYWSGLMFWSGGAFQYAIWPLPLLATVRPRLALAYGVACGVWLGWSYAAGWAGGWPPESVFGGSVGEGARVAMLPPMLLLLAATVSLWREPAPPQELLPAS